MTSLPMPSPAMTAILNVFCMVSVLGSNGWKTKTAQAVRRMPALLAGHRLNTIGQLWFHYLQIVNKQPAPEDLRVFTVVARKSGFAAAAEELGASPAYVSKRIRLLEEEPRGLLRVSSSFGFGRHVIAPALSRLVERHPGLQVRLDVFDRLVDVAGEGFDLDVRVGDEIAPHLIARRLADNHRVLCAAPAYLARRGLPRTPAELPAHDCLAIKERDQAFGVWRLRAGAAEQAVKVTGPLSANNGEMVVQWAVDGRGIALRSLWDVGGHLQAGRLVQVLPEWRQEANVWAVYPTRLQLSAKVRVCVEFLQEHFRQEWMAAAP
jgi:LysR family transcriptional activator of dmlA